MAQSERRSLNIRLPVLYAGFLGFAILAAWAASVGLGSRTAPVLPSAAVIDQPVTSTRSASPVAPMNPPPEAKVSSSPAPPPSPATPPNRTTPPTGGGTVGSLGPAPAAGPANLPPPVQTQIVPPDGT
ncbi:MAG TPA: hypothetical protein VNG12_11110, partial [Acidimicrobiales bacterium]|nr:hypothetical protein [Acidimicrobiales bacterium]